MRHSVWPRYHWRASYWFLVDTFASFRWVDRVRHPWNYRWESRSGFTYQLAERFGSHKAGWNAVEVEGEPPIFTIYL